MSAKLPLSSDPNEAAASETLEPDAARAGPPPAAGKHWFFAFDRWVVVPDLDDAFVLA